MRKDDPCYYTVRWSYPVTLSLFIKGRVIWSHFVIISLYILFFFWDTYLQFYQDNRDQNITALKIDSFFFSSTFPTSAFLSQGEVSHVLYKVCGLMMVVFGISRRSPTSVFQNCLICLDYSKRNRAQASLRRHKRDSATASILSGLRPWFSWLSASYPCGNGSSNSRIMCIVC